DAVRPAAVRLLERVEERGRDGRSSACHGPNLQGDPGSQQPPGPGARCGDTRGWEGSAARSGAAAADAAASTPPWGGKVLAAEASEVSIAQPRPVTSRRSSPASTPSQATSPPSTSTIVTCEVYGRSPVARPRWAWTSVSVPRAAACSLSPGQPAAWQHT